MFLTPGRFLKRLLLVVLVASLWPAFAQAVSLFKGVMPGKVAEPHAKVEESCFDCHAALGKAFRAKCVACHKEVEIDLTKRRGFHGKTDTVTCESCHGEHKGRAFQLVTLDQKAFDHAKTEYALEGKHRTVACDKCHLKPKFRETARDCFTCHKKDDPHKNILGPKCETCHTADDWKTITFDHNKTDYPLTGKHRDTKCLNCHKTPKLGETPHVCYTCHKKDDRHEGNLSTQCADCHTTADWKKFRFDHSKTRYPLLGKHADVACDKCHAGERYKGVPTVCIECHKKDDYHKGLFGPRCEHCHVERGWKKSTFDHDKTNFPLVDAHIKVKCETCHTTPKLDHTPTACAGCHAKDDVHEEKLGNRCETCHDAKTWKKAATFDHQQTDFPLTGKHKPVECEKCHRTKLFADASTICIACHKKDDEHKGRFGTKCERCHTDQTWERKDFDHRKETGYALEGAHVKVKCLTCHTRPLFTTKTSTLCGVCHRSDDIHEGELGPRCDRCHSVFEFILKR